MTKKKKELEKALWRKGASNREDYFLEIENLSLITIGQIHLIQSFENGLILITNDQIIIKLLILFKSSKYTTHNNNKKTLENSLFAGNNDDTEKNHLLVVY